MHSRSYITVRYAETDKMGIAHHSNYPVWFEVGRTDFIKMFGSTYSDMEKAGLIAQLRDGTGGLGELGKVEKIYLDNTNLMNSLGDGEEDAGTIRETFFFNQMRVNQKVTSSSLSDFDIKGMTFEVGGKSKGKRQIAEAKEGYVVKDDIEYGYGNVVPLWAFGLNY